MSFINRITRALDSFNQISNDETTKFGMAGEQEAKRFIKEENGLILYNPIIPHPKDKNKFLEIDSIIYNGNQRMSTMFLLYGKGSDPIARVLPRA